MTTMKHFYIPSKRHKFWLEGCLDCTHFSELNVEMHHDDTTALLWRNAFWTLEDDMLVVYSEHCGYHAFHPDDWAVNLDNHSYGPAHNRRGDGCKPFPKDRLKTLCRQFQKWIHRKR